LNYRRKLLPLHPSYWGNISIFTPTYPEMRMFIRAFIVAFSLLSTAATAADYRPYANGRFGYSIDLPLGFKTILTPENRDGIGLESADGHAKLSVWGNYLTEGGFSQESDFRKKFEIDEGWNFTYEKRGASWASMSGVKGDRIIYMRQIALCDDAMGNFTLEYPAAQQKRYGPVVDRMVKTLKAPKHCE
jgi:hypothetical protein